MVAECIALFFFTLGYRQSDGLFAFEGFEKFDLWRAREQG